MFGVLLALGLSSIASGRPHVGNSAAACSPLELLIARGSGEPLAPSYGVVVGDPLFEMLQKSLPEVTAYKVDYPASFAANSRDLGAADVVKHLTEQSKTCPAQSFALVGYSQGGDVMHSAAAKLDKSLFDKIVAVVMYGDPGNRGPGAKSPLACDAVPMYPPGLAEKVQQNCEKGDPVCTNDGISPEAHLLYSDPAKGYLKGSVEYIQKQLQTKGKAGPVASPNVGTGNNTKALLELGKLLGGLGTGEATNCMKGLSG